MAPVALRTKMLWHLFLKQASDIDGTMQKCMVNNSHLVMRLAAFCMRAVHEAGAHGKMHTPV